MTSHTHAHASPSLVNSFETLLHPPCTLQNVCPGRQSLVTQSALLPCKLMAAPPTSNPCTQHRDPNRMTDKNDLHIPQSLTLQIPPPPPTLQHYSCQSYVLPVAYSFHHGDIAEAPREMITCDRATEKVIILQLACRWELK